MLACGRHVLSPAVDGLPSLRGRGRHVLYFMFVWKLCLEAVGRFPSVYPRPKTCTLMQAWSGQLRQLSLSVGNRVVVSIWQTRIWQASALLILSYIEYRATLLSDSPARRSPRFTPLGHTHIATVTMK